MKITMNICIELDDNFFGSSDEEIEWLKNDILKPDDLIIHSNEIGDYLGSIVEMKDIEIIK